mgnify:CR=1 FL=1
MCKNLKNWKKQYPIVVKKAKQMEALGIHCLFFGIPEYPLALSYCADAPLVLYVKRLFSFKDRVIVSKVGTRQNTPHVRAFCEELIEKLSSVSLTFQRQAGEEDKIFGSVTNIEISKELEKQGYSVDKRDIELPEAIKFLGQHKATVNLGADLKAELVIAVEKV